MLALLSRMDLGRSKHDAFESWRSSASRLRLVRSPADSAYLSGSVGDAIEGQLSGSWADGGVGGVDLSGVDDGLVAVGSRGSGCESENGDGGELHFVGWVWY